MHRVLVTEPLMDEGMAVLRSGARVDVQAALTPAELERLIGEYDGLVVRSKTQVTESVLAAGRNLIVVGRAGTGVDNISLEAATRRGIVIVNAPFGNTVSVAEHALGLMLAVARNIPRADAALHQGRWLKQGCEGVQLRGKTLGIVGLGRVGAALARRAQGLEMKVIAFDAFVTPERSAQLGAQWVSLDDLLRQSDFISLHLPDTVLTRGIVGARELGLMKPTAYLINCARGSLVQEDELVEALALGRIAGAGLDVFAHEPPSLGGILDSDRVVLTPHLAGSTAEAQRDTAVEVAQQVLDVLAGRIPSYPVNAPALPPDELAEVGPYLDLAQRLGSFYAQYKGDHLRALEVACAGEVAQRRIDMIVASVLVGLLAGSAEEHVNWVNSRAVAGERGMAVTSRSEPVQFTAGWSNLIEVCLHSGGEDHTIGGTLLRGEPHIVRLDDFWFDFAAHGLLLVSEHVEQPGIIGRMGTLLGTADVNISFLQVGRHARGGSGVMVLGVDDAVTPDVLQQVLMLPSVRTAQMVRL
jgi:D-3-phosphoglycerate dehydrogenase / 2-oxoglutarate reductase